MKFNVTSNLSKLLAKVPQAAERADHILANQAKMDTEQFVPASGAQAGMYSQTKVVGGKIIYPGPYAHYLYVGKLFVDPETRSPWASKGATKVSTDRNLVFKDKAHGGMHINAQSHWFEVSKALNIKKWEDDYEKEVVKELGK